MRNLLNEDPLAHAEELPDIRALQEEFELALKQGPQSVDDISLAENTRYNRWNGKSSDGLKWQKNQAQGVTVRPYDGKPDGESNLSDDTINAQVDLDYTSFFSARISAAPTHATQLTAQQMAEFKCIVRWMKEGPLRAKLIDGVEYASQSKNTIGWCVLHPCWKVKHGLRKESISMEAIVQIAQEAAGTPLENLPMLIADPTMQDAAVELTRMVYPYLRKTKASQIVRELRDNGETEFVYREVQENSPTLKVLIPGIDVFLPEETQDIQDARAIMVREYFTQGQLEAMEVNDGWDKEFIMAAVATAGKSSEGTQNTSATEDAQSRRIEIITAYVKQTDEDGVPGIYCTVFSNQVGALPQQRPTGSFAKHFLCDYAHGQYPFLIARTEVIGPRPNDSRGIPRILRADQNALKRMKDGLHIFTELSTTPPIKRIGGSLSKMPLEFTPGGTVPGSPGQSFEALDLTRSAKPDVTFKVMELMKMERNDYFGLPSVATTSHPSRWQARQTRNTQRWLMVWGQALWQLAVLCYDNYSPEELTAIIGRPPLLTADTLLKHQLSLQFDPRTLDSEWVIELAKTISQYVLPFDRSGTIDLAKLTKWMLAGLDTTMSEEVALDQQGAAQAVFNEVRQEVAWIMQGNEASYTQNDPTASQKLNYLKQILMGNPAYQLALSPVLPEGQQNPQFNAMVFERMQKYEENLRHSRQEMEISPTQGRLGITPGGMEQEASILPEGQVA